MKGIFAFPQAPDWGTPTRYQDPLHYNWHGNCRFAIRKPQYLWDSNGKGVADDFAAASFGCRKINTCSPKSKGWGRGTTL